MDYHHVVAKTIYYLKNPTKTKVFVITTLLGKLCDCKHFNIYNVYDIVVNLLRIYNSNPDMFSEFIKMYENKCIDKTTDFLIEKICKAFDNEDDSFLALLLKENLVFVENVRKYRTLLNMLPKVKNYLTKEEYSELSKMLSKYIAKGGDIYGTYI